MNLSLTFVRVLFVLLSVLFMIAYFVGVHDPVKAGSFLWGGVTGLLVGGGLIGIELFFRRFTLRSLNIATLGLFFGYLFALALVWIFDALVSITSIQLTSLATEIIKIFIFLGGTYFGVMMTLRAADSLNISIPFLRLSPQARKTRDILVDLSALADPRLIDLAASGLLDGRLVVPRVLLQTLYLHEKHGKEAEKEIARRSLHILKKLESIPTLGLRYHDTDFPDEKDIVEKVLRLARLIDADLLSTEIDLLRMVEAEGVRVINVQTLSKALKPLMSKGEFLKVKIQRYGTEEGQGVGYLEDGTMVVVNGGGDFVGETISVLVLSVKHTSSGRLIFSNAMEETR